VFDVRLFAVAPEVLGVAHEYADVVQHGAGFHKIHVNIQFLVLRRQFQRLVGHGSAVLQEYIVCNLVVLVVSLYQI
jgi:hypothetical protein